MRAPSFPKKPRGLGLLVGGLLGLVTHSTEGRAAQPAPWSPPTRARSEVPADPAQALQALAVHGGIPVCSPRESIEDVYSGDMDHHHRFLPVRPLPQLQGQAEKILPYLGHSSEPVVHRAASLLCFIQDTPSKRGLTWLVKHSPCRAWIARVSAGAGISRRRASCPKEKEDGGYALLTTPPDGGKPSPAALALARRISEGEATAVREALVATQAMVLARRAEGVQALTKVSTVPGLALVYRALLEGWEKEVLSASTDWVDRKSSVKADALLQGVGNAALHSVSQRTERSREAVLVDTVALLPESLVTHFYSMVNRDPPLRYAMGRFARSPTGREVKSTSARTLLDRIDRETFDNDPQEIEAESRRLTTLFKAKDEVALERVLSSARQPFHRMLAACYLVGLGAEGPALTRLERAETLTLHDGNAIRVEVKRLLEGAKPGATRERLQRIYAKLDERCRLNDCSVESPR